MFSKKRTPQKRASDVSSIVRSSPSPLPSSSSPSPSPYNQQPLVSPLRMTFDFEDRGLVSSPTVASSTFTTPTSAQTSSTVYDYPSSPFSPSLADTPTRPKTSHGTPLVGCGRSVSESTPRTNTGLQPPLLPPIPRVASGKSSIRSASSGRSGEQDGPRQLSRERDLTRDQERMNTFGRGRVRDEPDNVSSTSKKSALKARLSFEHPMDMLPPLASAPNTPRGSSNTFDGPHTAAGGSSNNSTPKMESSLFPARNDIPLLSQPSGQTPMTRQFIDSRDRPYQPRPFMMQGNHSSPSLLANPQPGPSNGRQPTPVYASSRNFISPKPSLQNLSRTDLSGSTARPSTQASTGSGSPTITIGTPYQSTANTFPLPQHVKTRPKLPGAMATVAGVSVPTHHTGSSQTVGQPSEAKEPKKKTRLRNPLALLQRRRSNQDSELVLVERAQRQAQAQALARQRDVAQSGIYKPPPDFDPRIKGKVVHDFSAPRSSKRNTFDELNLTEIDMQSPDSGQIPSPGHPPRNASLVNRGPMSDRSERRESTHTPKFMEHLGENPEASRRMSSLQAENLENKDFLQRASKHSSMTNYSQESAILPPFARRSQTLDPAQASLYKDDESKQSSHASSEKERDSMLGSFDQVSPVTARGSGGHLMDQRQSFSPVSPSSPSGGRRPVSEMTASSSGRPPSDMSSQTDSQSSGKRPISQLTKSSSQEKHLKSTSEGTARPYSVVLAPPVISTIDESSVESSPIDEPITHSPKVLSHGLSFYQSASSSPDPDAVRPFAKDEVASLTPSLEGISGEPTPERTPEPERVRSIQFQPVRDQPKLVEKRASAVGHAKKSSNGPKHHASNASRFSFQAGSESALQEQALEEKHRKMRTSEMVESLPRGATPDDEYEDDFDADAMDDMDEMELEATQFGDEVQPVPETLTLPAQTGVPSQSSLYLQQAREVLQQDSYSDDGSVYDEEIPEVTNEADVPYPDHPAFRTHSALGNYSQRNSDAQGTSDGYWRGSTIDHYMRDSYFQSPHSRGQSQASTVDLSPTEGGTSRSSRPRSNFYLQPKPVLESPPKDKPPVSTRDSGNNERDRVPSDATVTRPASGSSSEEEPSTSLDSDRERVISGMSFSTTNSDDFQSPQKKLAPGSFLMQAKAPNPLPNFGPGVSDSIFENIGPPTKKLDTPVANPQRQHGYLYSENARARGGPVGAAEDVTGLGSPPQKVKPRRADDEPLRIRKADDEAGDALTTQKFLGRPFPERKDSVDRNSPPRQLEDAKNQESGLERSESAGMGSEDFARSVLNSSNTPRQDDHLHQKAMTPVIPPATSRDEVPGNTKTQSPRTVSTGLGLSMFAGFDFEDQPPLPATSSTVAVHQPSGVGLAQAPAEAQTSPSLNAQQTTSETHHARHVMTPSEVNMFGGFEFDSRRSGPLPHVATKSRDVHATGGENDFSPMDSAFSPTNAGSVRPYATGNSSDSRSDSRRGPSFGQKSPPIDPAPLPTQSPPAPRGRWSELQKRTAPRQASPTPAPVPALHVTSDSRDIRGPQEPRGDDAGIGSTTRPSLQYSQLSTEDDDMYFDDGNFDFDINGAHGASFDENALDDDSFLSRPGLENRYRHQRDNSGMTLSSIGSDGPYPSFAMPNAARASARLSQMALEDIALQENFDPRYVPQRNPSEDAKRLGMSGKVPPVPVPESNKEAFSRMQQSLQSYHAQLADAANRAAADGRFVRAPSVSTTHTMLEPPGWSDDRSINDDKSMYSNDEQGGEIANLRGDNLGRSDTSGSHLTHLTNYSPTKMSFDFGFDRQEQDDGDDYDGFGNDDDLVAAANAEALALDEDGFYGQEFDFYRRPRANSGDLEAVNGGYFGEDGDDGLTRNKSLKEPNLTPITERSEFSTRNSFVNFLPGTLGAASAGLHGPHSPALARVPVTPLLETELMTFEELRKLKANAFAAGSQGGGSLKSNSNRSSSHSLQAGLSPTVQRQNYFSSGGGMPMQFAYSTDSSSASSSAYHPLPHPHHSFQESPHSAGSSQGMPFSMDVDATPRKSVQQSQPQEAPQTAKKVSSHSRKGSGADSVTYVREPDPDGGGKPRWVLERRRTSEQGQLELVGRELVQGGWI